MRTSSILTRLENHIAQMSPSQTTKLLVEAAQEIKMLQAQLRAVDSSLEMKALEQKLRFGRYART